MAGLIAQAYRVAPSEVWGPGWISYDGERFDVFAKLPEDSSKTQMPDMLQALLSERFRLSVHRVDRVEASYELVVRKGGHRMQLAAASDPEYRPDRTKAITIDELAARLSRNRDCTVVNVTNLDGRYWIPLSLLVLNAETQAF